MLHPKRSRAVAILAALLIAPLAFADGAQLPPAGAPAMTSANLGVVVNTADPLSIAIGNYYAAARNIPAANVTRVHFNPDRDVLPPDEFATIRAQVEKSLPGNIQGYALTWARPYR